MANFNFSSILPILTMVLIVIACIMAWRLNIKEFKQSHFAIFLDMLVPIGLVMVGVGIHTERLKLEVESRMSVFTLYKDRVGNLYNAPMDKLLNTPNIRPKFYASFFCNNTRLSELGANDDKPVTHESELAEQYFLMKILQVFEDFLMYERINDFEDPSWLGVFMQWAQSKYLQDNLEILEHLYADETIAFTHLLIEYAKEIPCPNTEPNLYKSLSDIMYRDERLKAIHESMFDKKF